LVLEKYLLQGRVTQEMLVILVTQEVELVEAEAAAEAVLQFIIIFSWVAAALLQLVREVPEALVVCNVVMGEIEVMVRVFLTETLVLRGELDLGVVLVALVVQGLHPQV
jgi:hypothetical protein